MELLIFFLIVAAILAGLNNYSKSRYDWSLFQAGCLVIGAVSGICLLFGCAFAFSDTPNMTIAIILCMIGGAAALFLYYLNIANSGIFIGFIGASLQIAIGFLLAAIVIAFSGGGRSSSDKS